MFSTSRSLLTKVTRFSRSQGAVTSIRSRQAVLSQNSFSTASSKAEATGNLSFSGSIYITFDLIGNTGQKHRSNAEQLIAEFPVVEVSSTRAICDGGGGVLGHPVEYIQLDNMTPEIPTACQYCGTRFVMKPGNHHTH